MIILAGVLVVLAIALLVTGIVMGNTGHEILGLEGLKLIYVSIGVSIVSALFLAVGVFLRRKELFGTAPSLAAQAAGGRMTTRPVKAKARVGAGDDAPTIPATSATATDVPAETTVYVVPGRKRYHLETCRQLAGRDKEELTFVEAREEGFTPCTACLPDTALAARASFTEPATRRPDESAGSPVEVTRTDIPAARLPVEPQPSADTRDDLRETGRTRELPAESAAPAAGAAAGRATPGTREPEAAEETVAAERPAEPPRRYRSMFEPLDRSGTEAAAARTTSGRRDDEDETTAAERAGTASRAGAETETARDQARTAAGESSRRPHEDEGTAEDAAAAGDAETGGRTTVAGADAAEGAVTSAEAAASKTTGAGEETRAGEPEAAEPAGETPSATTAPEREDAPGEAADGETPGTDTAGTGAADAGDIDEADAGADDRAEPADDGGSDATTDDDTSDAAAAHDATADAEAGHHTAGPADTDERAAGDDEAESGASGPVVRVLSGTKRYHRPDCALIEGIADDAGDLESLPRAEAKDRGCTPCLVCQPDDD